MVRDAVVWYGVTIAAPVLDGFLPLTETVQRLSSMVVDLQCRLVFHEQNEPCHHNVDCIPQARILEQFGNLTIFMRARMYCSMSLRPW